MLGRHYVPETEPNDENRAAALLYNRTSQCSGLESLFLLPYPSSHSTSSTLQNFSRTPSVLLCSALILPCLRQNLFFSNHSSLFTSMNLHLHYFPFTLMAARFQFPLFIPLSHFSHCMPVLQSSVLSPHSLPELSDTALWLKASGRT